MTNKKAQSVDFFINEAQTSEEIREHFLSIPNQNIRPLYNSMSNKSDLQQFITRQNAIGKGKQDWQVNSFNTKLSYKSKNADLEIVFSTPKKKLSKGCKNIFIYSLHKLGQQNITTNLFEDLSIEFPMQDLIDLGMYSSLRACRQAFNTAIDELTSIKIKASIKEKNSSKTVTTNNDITVMFIKAGYTRGNCYILLNKHIDWNLFALKTFALLPKSYFPLYESAQDLMFNIFSLARQKKQDIASKGYFTIGFRTIQSWLNLPDEKATPQAKRDTLGAIEKAVNAIKEAENSKDFIITLDYNRNGSIAEILNEGYITIHLKGIYAQKIIEINERQQAKITAENKKQERIIEQAKIKNLSEKLKKEDIQCQNKDSESL